MRLFACLYPLLLIKVALLKEFGFNEIPGHQKHHHHGNDNCYNNEAMTSVFSFLNYVNELVKDAQVISKKCLLNTEFKPMDCAEVQTMGDRNSGVHRIWPRNRVVQGPVDVLCDMDDDGGGWTIIQRRGDFQSAQDYFYRNWDSFKTGFGDINKDFWIGNEVIFALTNQRPTTIKFVLTDWEGNTTYASYDDFWIDDESHNYANHVDGYRGTAGDSFKFSHGSGFSTKDRKNDIYTENCAEKFQGAWWHVKCHESNLNGMYLKGQHASFANGVNWKSFKGYHYSLKDTFMKVRPKNYVPQNRLGDS